MMIKLAITFTSCILLLSLSIGWCSEKNSHYIKTRDLESNSMINEQSLCSNHDVDKHIQFYFNTNFPTQNCDNYYQLSPKKYPYLTPIKGWDGRSSSFVFLWFEGQGILIDKEAFEVLYNLFHSLKGSYVYKESVNHQIFFSKLKGYLAISNIHEWLNILKGYYQKFQVDNRFREVLEVEGYLKNGEYIFGQNAPRLNQLTSQDEFIALCVFNKDLSKIVPVLYEKYKETYVINGVIKPTVFPNISMSKIYVLIDGVPPKEIKCTDRCVFKHISLKDRYSVKIISDCFSEFNSVLKEQYPVIKLKPIGISIVSDKQTIMTGERLWLKAVTTCRDINHKVRYQWMINNKPFGSNSDKVEFVGSDVGSYNITVSIFDDSGKTIFEGKQIISVIERLTVGIVGPSEMIQNEEATFSIVAKTGSLQSGFVKYSCSWTVDNKRFGSNEGTVKLRFDTAGNHSIKLDCWQWIQKDNRWQKVGEAIHQVNVKPSYKQPNNDIF